MTRLVTHVQPPRRSRLLLMGLVLLVVGVALVAWEEAPLVGWITIAPGGVLVAVGRSTPTPPRQALVLDDAGVSDLIQGLGPVPWDEIVSARVERRGAHLRIALELSGGASVFLHADRLDHDAEQVAHLIAYHASGRRRRA